MKIIQIEQFLFFSLSSFVYDRIQFNELTLVLLTIIDNG